MSRPGAILAALDRLGRAWIRQRRARRRAHRSMDYPHPRHDPKCEPPSPYRTGPPGERGPD